MSDSGGFPRGAKQPVVTNISGCGVSPRSAKTVVDAHLKNVFDEADLDCGDGEQAAVASAQFLIALKRQQGTLSRDHHTKPHLGERTAVGRPARAGESLFAEMES